MTLSDPVPPPAGRTLPPFCVAFGLFSPTPSLVPNWAFGAPSRQPGLPGADVGDPLQGALDGGEGGACMRPGGVLIIQHCHPAGDAPQRLPADGPRQRWAPWAVS